MSTAPLSITEQEKLSTENAAEKTFAGHPRGLVTLFFTELWERFSYYGMRAILILYMVAPADKGGLGFTAAKAATIYGSYTALVYLSALPGGLLGDRILGARMAVLLGGCIIALGHFTMVYKSLTAFYAGMGLIIIGTGLLKPNVSSMVGSLYKEGDTRRDGGFSIFYMGINIGAFIAPLLCGYLGENVDWHWGFGAAGIGMVLGLLQFVFQRNYLGNIGRRVQPSTNHIVSEKKAQLTGDEKKRLVVIFVLFLFSALFFSAFEQAGSSLNLFAQQLTDRVIFGWEFPASWLQAVNSLFILAFTPVFTWFWLRLNDRKHEPSSPAKFAYGLFFTGAGFLVLTISSSFTNIGKVSPLWLIVVYLLHTIGELCLSPVGLSTVTKLAPARYVGLMMGVWFLATSVGNFVAGQTASLFDPQADGALVKLFGTLTLVLIIGSMILAVSTPYVRRLMGKVN